MATTFRSGPRDPVTGRSSARISPDNVVRSDGYTDRERAEISITPEDPRRQNQMRVPEGAGTFQEFMAASGRSDTNPYGDSGLFGASVNYRSNNPALGMNQGQIDAVNQLAYNQYLGLVSGRGTQRGGQGEFVPGYAPALKIGSNTPRGTVVAAPTQPEQSGGIADFFKLSPTLGLLKGLFSSGDIPRTLDDGGVDYSTEGIETLDAAPVLNPGEAAPAPSRKNNSLFNLEGFIENLPKGGVGRFVDQVQEKFDMGPGRFVPFFDSNKGQVGINYKIQLEKGGEVPAGEGLFSKEELARQDEIAAAELQPDGSLPGVDTMRFATPEEVDIGAYNFQKDLEDKLLYHIKERDKVSPFEFSGITANRKIFHQRQVESLQKQIEDFRGQRGAAVANYRDYIAAGGRPLYVNTDREPYFRGFPSDLINFRATNP